MVEGLANLMHTGAMDLEYRIADPDGRVRFIRNAARTVTGTDGTSTSVDGVLTDVTHLQPAQPPVPVQAHAGRDSGCRRRRTDDSLPHHRVAAFCHGPAGNSQTLPTDAAIAGA
jgi:hypothetical protein